MGETENPSGAKPGFRHSTPRFQRYDQEVYNTNPSNQPPDAMKGKLAKIEMDLLLQRLKRVTFDPDRYRHLTIVLMVTFGLLITFFVAGVVLYRISKMFISCFSFV